MSEPRIAALVCEGQTDVKAWCEAHASDLDKVLDPDVGDRIDLLVIAIDVDIAIEAKIADPPKGIGAYETKRLRRVIAGWLGGEVPPAVVCSTPVMAIEAWVIAALFRKQTAPESIGDPAAWLLEKKKLRVSPRTGGPWKELHIYRDFAPLVAKQLKRVRRVCSEAERTLHAVEQRRETLEGSQ